MNLGTPFMEISLVSAPPINEAVVTPVSFAVTTIPVVRLICIRSRNFNRQPFRDEAAILAGGGVE